MENKLNNKSTQSSNNSSMNSGQAAQGRSSQQATTGKGGMKNIQDMLQQYSGPIAQKINGLSTTQKVVGGSLLALGAGWIAMNSGNKNKMKSRANEITSSARQKAEEVSSTAKEKINSKNDNSSRESSNPTRTGSSAMDARVK